MLLCAAPVPCPLVPGAWSQAMLGVLGGLLREYLCETTEHHYLAGRGF